MIDFENTTIQNELLAISNQIFERVCELALSGYHGEIEYFEKTPGDVVTKVDMELEEMLHYCLLSLTIDGLNNVGFYSEEESFNKRLDAEYLWVVDPLDGTNNYAVQRPLFGTSIALLHNKQVVFGLLIDAPNKDWWVAMKGQGVWRKFKKYTRISNSDANKRMVVLTGHGIGIVKHEFIASILQLHYGIKRVISSWSPVMDILLFVRGGCNFIFFYAAPIHDMAAGLLMCQELGANLVLNDKSLVLNKPRSNFLSPVSGTISIDEPFGLRSCLVHNFVKIYNQHKNIY